MIPIAIRFAYDGNEFPSGYARQPQGGTVEDGLIQALRKEGFVAGSWKTGSRTDRGVSAIENVAACSLDRARLEGLLPALQGNLPPGVWITAIAPVPAEWNPRHHAMRAYSYIAAKDGEELDAMARAAQCFEGNHDMSAFAKVEEHRNPNRIIERCQVADGGDHWRFSVASPGFLWNQVRRMVDAMLRVGRGQVTVADVQEALVSGIPPGACQMAPAEGLLLESVRYNPDLAWSEEVGAFPPWALTSAWQAAHVRSRLVARLSELQ